MSFSDMIKNFAKYFKLKKTQFKDRFKVQKNLKFEKKWKKSSKSQKLRSKTTKFKKILKLENIPQIKIEKIKVPEKIF